MMMTYLKKCDNKNPFHTETSTFLEEFLKFKSDIWTTSQAGDSFAQKGEATCIAHSKKDSV